MKILIIDNFDSFTYNLFHIIEQYADETTVIRNDKVDIEKISFYDKILFSPGPGLPSEYPVMGRIIQMYANIKPILGICLGHQAIASYYGGGLKNMDEVNHGIEKYTIINDVTEPLFRDIPVKFLSGRYHSWVVDSLCFPDCLKITAIDTEGLIMAIGHRQFNIKGLQFHPESVMTPVGNKIIANWINCC
ncbi:MAG: aminodeoxychorismate/anthranilate synthase component II [Bacteroidia bacterium]|nr:aminodeoxychorismate/anthranilate synthase component II [Bacteroidia bacterium]